MKVLFSRSFKKSLEKYSSLKNQIKKKVDMIIEHPVSLSEPLKGDLRGYYSCPVKRSFIIIFQYCKQCRSREDDKYVLCKDCKEMDDDTLRFIEIAPHDLAYKKAKKSKGL